MAVNWVVYVTYAVVLAGGLLQSVADGGRPWAFLAAMGVLAGVELVAWRARLRPGVLLAARCAAYVVVAATDPSGIWRALLILVPFTARFVFGRAVAAGTAAATVAAFVGALTVMDPGWLRDAEQVSDLLMFVLGEVIALAMADVALRERTGRERLRTALDELADHAARIEELSTARERNRLAREIHDSLGHHLTAIGLQLEKAEAYRDREPATADRALADARWSANQALAEARDSVRALRTDGAGFSLVAALRELVARSGDERLAVHLSVIGEEHGHPSDVRTSLYRAAQEGLTNVLRHAHATRVEVHVALDGPVATLEVTDDGIGLPGSEGFGLRGLRERCALLGGRLELAPGPSGKGTTLRVSLPGTQVQPA